MIDDIASQYYLVNLVDNDFPAGSEIWNLIDDMFDRKELNGRINANQQVGPLPGLVTNSILFCLLFKIKDRVK